MQNISIFAKSFKEGEMIPDKFTCKGRDVSPELTWSGVPKDTKSFVLIVDDPDAPGGTWIHWILFNISPTIQKIPEGFRKDQMLGESRQGINSFRNIGYGGPCPPPGMIHRYYFKIYALDKMLYLQPGIDIERIQYDMKGHILAMGQLMGRYKR